MDTNFNKASELLNSRKSIWGECCKKGPNGKFYEKFFHKWNRCKFDHLIQNIHYFKKKFFYNLVPFRSTYPIYPYWFDSGNPADSIPIRLESNQLTHNIYLESERPAFIKFTGYCIYLRHFQEKIPDLISQIFN